MASSPSETTKGQAPATGRTTWHRSRGIIRRVGGAAKTTLALVGFVTVAAVASQVKIKRDVELDKSEKKKRVLVLPFHRMRLVETKRFSLGSAVRSFDDEDEDRIIEIEVKEICEALHKAAEDPNIVALYARFGQGFAFSAGGYAQIEEVRNAVKVFRESHRGHLEPNLSFDKVLVRSGNASPKPTYAFADSFANPLDPGNKEYYLASVFSHVHLQNQGELNLFGMVSSNAFFKPFLHKYGIKVHVFKHGKYKNAPNAFTESSYTGAHSENVKNILESVNKHICDGIVDARGLESFDPHVWKMIRNHGTFTATQARDVGLIDYLPPLDPLSGLLFSNENEEAKATMKDKWGKETDMDKFDATDAISLSEYTSLLAKRKKLEERQWHVYRKLKQFAEKSSAAELVLSAAGYKAPNFNIEKEAFVKEKGTADKIALVNVVGAINDAVARRTVGSLRKIKKENDVKCVILRVDSPGGSITASEAILQECKDMPQPVICSMGNVAASGGYYIATGCNRIFALPSTVTGSVGVFGVKVDLTGLGKQYGINVDHIVTGPHSTTFDAFHPLTRPVKMNFSRNIDRYYDYFKSIVASSRGLSMEQVEELAQGRVWTGEQAKSIGLVDELGGFARAVAYARRSFTEGEASLEVWPKQPTLKEKLQKASRMLDDDNQSLLARLVGGTATLFGIDLEEHTNEASTDSISRLLMSNGADPLSIHGVSVNPATLLALPPHLSGVSMTLDESTALSYLIQENVKNYEASTVISNDFLR